MSVDANTGNAFLDSYARQINQLEKDPNATPEYDAALEKQFDAVKAQVLGDGGSTPGAGNGGPATTHGTGSSGATGSTGSKGGPGSPPATGSNSGTTPPPPVADSIGQITSTAGPDAAATVQKIADGAAASIGGSAGTSVAATAAQAGANAAQHVIDTGGTSAQAATAAQTAAQAVATAGAAGGPAAAANVATIADPATAQSVANTAAHAAETAGGGAVGSAIAAAVTRAGAAGGAAAAEAVATAAEIGGVAAATATADAAVFASVVAGGGAAGETAAATAAQAAADVAGRVHDAGGSADEAATASRLVADAAEAGGAKLAGDVASVVNMATLLGGTTNDMARLANDVTRAFNIGGAGTADAVVGTAGEVFGGAMLNQIAGNSAGSSLADIENVASTIVEAAEQGGPELAEDVASVVTTVASAGGTGANMTAAADAVTNAFVWGETAGAQAVRNAVESASSHGVADIADVASTVAEIVDDYGAGAAEEAVPAIVTVAAAGGSVADMTDVADAVASAFAEDGVDGAEAVVQAVQGASRSGVDNIASVASIVSNAVTEHGSAFAQDVGQAVDMVAAAGGDADNMRETAEALDLAFQHGRQDTADAVVRAAQAVADVGGNGEQITDISYTVAESAEALFLSGEGNPADLASAMARAAQRAAASMESTSPTDVIAAASAVANPPAVPQPPSPTASTPGSTNIVATASGDPLPLNPVGPADNAYAKLLDELQSGGDQSTIQKDAQQLAIIAAKLNDGNLEKVALLVGSGMYGGSAVDMLKAASPEQADQDNVYAPHGTDPLGGLHGPLNDAYLQLEVDIAGGADQQTIKADADNVAKLAGDAGRSGLALAASNISNSITDRSYDQGGSLTALMNNPPTSGSASPGPPASPPSDADAYQKLLNDVQSGADHVTIITDAAQLAIAAAASGDGNLEYVARNIGDSIGNGSYSKDGSAAALTNAAPGTSGAKAEPQGPFAQATDTGSAYLKLEHDVESGADSQTIKTDAEQVRTLAEKDGNTFLETAADAISSEIDGGSYNQVGAEEALMNDGATNVELGFSPIGGPSSSPDEASAYQKLLTDIRSGADKPSILNDVLVLSSDAIKNGNFGLSQVAIDIGFSIKDNKFDADTALQSLTGAAPGTAAAQLPPVSGVAA